MRYFIQNLPKAELHLYIEGTLEPELMKRLKVEQTPLTMCSLSNLKLKVVDDLRNYNLLRLLEYRLCVTVNSDDPAYFGGYLNENFEALAKSLNPSEEQLKTLAKNSFRASFLDEDTKQRHIDAI